MDLSAIKLGSLVEGPAIFAPLAPTERVCLTAVKIHMGVPLKVEFKATLFGVVIGFVSATESPKNGSSPVWEWRKS